VISPLILIVCILSFALLMSAVSMIVVRASLREVPSQLMRPKAPKSSKPIFLEKNRFIWNRFSFTGKITARNLIRYKSRFLMTVIGVAGCTGLLVVGWGIKNSIADIVNIQFGDIFNYQYTVNLEDDRNLDEFIEVLTDDLEVDYSVPYMGYSTKYYDGKSDDKTLNAIVVDAKQSRNILNLRRAGTRTKINLSANGVIISEKFAKNNNIRKGDTITIESKSGYKADVLVDDVAEFYFQHYVFISESYYKSVFGEAVHPHNIAVSSENGKKMVSEISEIEGYRSTGNFNSMISTFNNMIKALDYIIMVIIITAGALALVVLINLTQVNISERMREIATLKVLGFRNGEVNAYLFKEILLLSVIGGLLGLPLGVIEHHFIMNIISMEMIKFGNVIRPISFVYAFAITILFTLFVLQLTKKPLRKIQMVESLKSVE
ncbi:MAG: ABC transporter permease, partial [Clostridia bacterium]|nr:ABC transporter permease [Clostridia bacterium]